MDTRSELIRLARAGEPTAIQSLIEQNHALIYRITLSVLNEPAEAAQAAHKSEIALIENLANYPGPAAHTAWVYRITLQVCRRRLRWQAWFWRFDTLTRGWRRWSTTQSAADKIRSIRSKNPLSRDPASVNSASLPALLTAVASLEDDLRLPLLLRYRHDLLPDEIAEVLAWRNATVQSRLRAARARLRRLPNEESLVGLRAGLLTASSSGRRGGGRSDSDSIAQGLSHHQAENLIEVAADFRIIDADAGLLDRHLKGCPYCQDKARRLAAFENELRAALHQRWDTEPIPAVEAAATVVDHHHQTDHRRALNLVGAILMTLFMVGLIVLLPSLLPDRILPPPAAQRPEEIQPLRAPAAGDEGPAIVIGPVLSSTESPVLGARNLPEKTATPTPVFQRQRGFPTGQAITPRAFSQRNLVSQIYPGKIAFVAFNNRSDQVFAFAPGQRETQLSNGNSENSFPTWSPDGSQLAYLSLPQRLGPNQIMVVNSDGSNQRVVTPANAPGAALATPTPFPNDRQYPQFPQYGPPHWSADGKSVATALWASPTSYFVAIFPVNGGREIRLPVDDLDRDFLDWSPDGSTIAYLAKGGRELWLWEPGQALVAGQNPKKIYFDGSWDMVFGLAWSPDSYSIAVLSGLREQDVVQVDLRIMRKYGIEARNIPVSKDILTRTAQHSSALAWSPDGIYLAFTPVFTNNDLVHGRVMLVRAEGRSTLPALAEMDHEVTSLAWSPDGRWLAFSTGYEVWAASLEAYEKDEGALVRLSRSTGYALSWQRAPQKTSP